MINHQEANIWIGSSGGKEPCYNDRNRHSADTGAAGQHAHRIAEQEAMVRSIITCMVKRTIANVVRQEQEAHNNRLGKPEKKMVQKIVQSNSNQFGKR